MNTSATVINDLERDGHGHVYLRSDGVKARCGGATFCDQCRREQALVDELVKRNAIAWDKIGQFSSVV